MSDVSKSVRIDPKTYTLLRLQAKQLYRTLSGHIRALVEAYAKPKPRKPDVDGHR